MFGTMVLMFCLLALQVSIKNKFSYSCLYSIIYDSKVEKFWRYKKVKTESLFGNNIGSLGVLN